MAEAVRRVRPTPIAGYLANPHRGCCTFQHFTGDELFAGTSWSEEGPTQFPPRKYPGVTPGYLPSTVSYCRWFWELFEREEGRYDFSVIDQAIKTAQDRGQTLAIRVMAYGSPRQPQLPAWFIKKYNVPNEPVQGTAYYPPDHDSAAYSERYGAVIRECGRRFDGHAQIETMDVGYIGPWGEGAGKCSTETMHRFNQIHKEAFPTTPRLIEICEEQGKVGIQYGAGWRWNCYGDLSDTGSPQVLKNNSWNHHYDAYPQAIAYAGAHERWKTQPIHFESCWVPMHWYEQSWDLDFILQQGLKYHLTYFMPKYTRLPEAWLGKLSDFCNMIGYRFIYRQALFETPLKAGGNFRFQSWIENVGVAPIYRRYALALRLRQGDREEFIRLPEIDIRSWLPGDTLLDVRLQLPPSIKPGWCELAAGLVDAGGVAKVSFANKEVFSDRWLALAGLEVQ